MNRTEKYYRNFSPKVADEVVLNRWERYSQRHFKIRLHSMVGRGMVYCCEPGHNSF